MYSETTTTANKNNSNNNNYSNNNNSNTTTTNNNNNNNKSLGSSVCWELGGEAMGSWFEPQCIQNIVVGEGFRALPRCP